MGLQQFERRLERLVEGAFAKAFRTGLQPVEIGRRLVREVDARRQLGVRGIVAPNHFVVRLSPDDAERFAAFHDALAHELAEAAREHARREGYRFLGPVEVELAGEPGRTRGDLAIDAEIAEGEGLPASLVLPGGQRVPLGQEPARIGRLPDCVVTLTDPQVSRHHAEVRPGPLGYRIVDLGSTNGTTVNGAVVREHDLLDGDEIVVGGTAIRFEEA